MVLRSSKEASITLPLYVKLTTSFCQVFSGHLETVRSQNFVGNFLKMLGN